MKIDIALALYNGENFLKVQLDSIANQTYQNFIIHVCDDGSSDLTIDICQNHELYVQGKLIIHDVEKVGGAHQNFTRVLKYCNSDYVAFCDQDDYWMTDKLEKLLEFMVEKEKLQIHEIPVLIFSDLEVVDSNLNIIHKSFYSSSLKSSQCNSPFDFLISNHIPGCVMFFNKKLKEMSEPIPNKFRMHDWWIAFVASYYGKIFFYNQSLIKYRQHSNNTVGVVGMNKNKLSLNILTRFSALLKTLKKVKAIRYFYQVKVLDNQNSDKFEFNKFLYDRLSLKEKIKIFKTSKFGESLIISFLIWFLL